MKICLIDPPLTTGEYAGKFKRIANVLPSLGLGYIAGVLEKEGIEVKIIDCRPFGTSVEELVKEVSQYAPQLIGITATTLSFEHARVSAEAIKKALPDSYIVLGGPHITAIPDEAMRHECFDLGVLGEGEYTFLKIVKALDSGSLQTEGLDAVAYRQDGQVKVNAQAGYIDNLDALPNPARHLYAPLKFYKPVAASYKRLPFAHIMTSRGCPYRCTFCDRKVFGNRFRARSPENVIAEIEELTQKYGAREIKFFDDTFTVSKDRAAKICEMIIEKKMGFVWSCLSHVKGVTKDLLKLMRRAGCWQIGFGLESGDPDVLESMRKSMVPEDSAKAVKWAKQAGLNVRAFFVIGMPGDTVDSINRTLEFAKSLPLDVANFYNVTLYPGNELFDIAQKEGTLLHKNWSQFCQLNIPDSADIAYVPKGMTEAELRDVSAGIHRKFYMRPGYIMGQLAQIRSFGDIKRYWDGFLTVAGL